MSNKKNKKAKEENKVVSINSKKEQRKMFDGGLVVLEVPLFEQSIMGEYSRALVDRLINEEGRDNVRIILSRLKGVDIMRGINNIPNKNAIRDYFDLVLDEKSFMDILPKCKMLIRSGIDALQDNLWWQVPYAGILVVGLQEKGVRYIKDVLNNKGEAVITTIYTDSKGVKTGVYEVLENDGYEVVPVELEIDKVAQNNVIGVSEKEIEGLKNNSLVFIANLFPGFSSSLVTVIKKNLINWLSEYETVNILLVDRFSPKDNIEFLIKEDMAKEGLGLEKDTGKIKFFYGDKGLSVLYEGHKMGKIKKIESNFISIDFIQQMFQQGE